MTLKRELERPGSPIRLFLADHLPDTAAARRQYAQALGGATLIGAPAVLSARSQPAPARQARTAAAVRYPYDVVGHGFGIAVTLTFSTDPKRHVRQPLLHPLTGSGWPAAEQFWSTWTRDVPLLAGALHAGGTGSAGREQVLRLCLVAGLFDQLYRAGPREEMPLLALPATASIDEILALPARDVVEDVDVLLQVAARELAALAATAAESGCVVCPGFGGASLVGGADGDLVVGTTLLEVKALLEPTLQQRHLHQLVSYALLDFEDAHHLSHVALYAARHGRLVTWPLDELLSTMARQPVRAADLRFALKNALS